MLDEEESSFQYFDLKCSCQSFHQLLAYVEQVDAENHIPSCAPKPWLYLLQQLWFLEKNVVNQRDIYGEVTGLLY